MTKRMKAKPTPKQRIVGEDSHSGDESLMKKAKTPAALGTQPIQYNKRQANQDNVVQNLRKWVMEAMYQSL